MKKNGNTNAAPNVSFAVVRQWSVVVEEWVAIASAEVWYPAARDLPIHEALVHFIDAHRLDVVMVAEVGSYEQRPEQAQGQEQADDDVPAFHHVPRTGAAREKLIQFRTSTNSTSRTANCQYTGCETAVTLLSATGNYSIGQLAERISDSPIALPQP